MMMKQKKCPSCGAPIVSEICAYCQTATGLHTAEADMEYPVLECKEATINFWTVCFPMIFAVSFGICGIVSLIIFLTKYRNMIMLLIGGVFSFIGIGALVFVMRAVSRYMKVKTRGKVIQATVYGYMNDNLLINNQPAQIVKLLIQTPNGPRFVLYQLGNTLKPYKINDHIEIMVYQEYFMICKNQEVAY